MKEISIFQIRSNHKWETQEPDVEELHEPDADESNEPKVFPNFMMCKYYSKLNKRKSKNLKSNETQRGVGREVEQQLWEWQNGGLHIKAEQRDMDVRSGLRAQLWFGSGSMGCTAWLTVYDICGEQYPCKQRGATWWG